MPMQPQLLTFAFSQVAKIVFISKFLYPMIFCKGLGSSCLKLIMNMSRTSKRSDSPAFPSQHPLITFPFIWAFYGYWVLRVNTPNTSSPPCNTRPGPEGLFYSAPVKGPGSFTLPYPNSILGPGTAGLGDKLASPITQGSDFLGEGLTWGVDTTDSNGLFLRAPTPISEMSVNWMSFLKWNPRFTTGLTPAPC